MLEELTSTVDVIDALGGTSAVAKLTGRTYPAAFNWRSFDTFPSDTYLVMTAALESLGKRAHPRLWRMAGAETAAS